MRTTLIALAVLPCAACGTKNAGNRPDSTAPAAATVAASPTTNADARKFIDSVTVRYIDAVTKGDVAAISSLYTDDTEILAPNAKATHGRAEMDKANSEMFKAMKVSLKLATEDVQTSGDLAVQTGTYDQTLQPKTGKALHDVGKYLLVWKRQPDGGWKVFREIYNTDLPAKM